MSMENLNKFMQMIKEDEVISKKAKEIGYQNDGGLMAYAKQLGLAFDLEDLEALKKQLLEEKQELGDEELENVSGGWLFHRRWIQKEAIEEAFQNEYGKSE